MDIEHFQRTSLFMGIHYVRVYFLKALVALDNIVSIEVYIVMTSKRFSTVFTLLLNTNKAYFGFAVAAVFILTL